MTKQEALAKIEELDKAIKTAERHREKLAKEHQLVIYRRDQDTSETFIPNIDEFQIHFGWIPAEGELNRDYGITIPGWVSSSTFC